MPTAPVPLSPPPSVSFANASPAATIRTIPSPPFPGPAKLPRARSESPTPSSGRSRLNETTAPEWEGEGELHGPGRHIPSPVSNVAARIAATGVAALKRPTQELHDARLKDRYRQDATDSRHVSSRSSLSEYDLKGGGVDIGQPDDKVRNRLAGMSLEDEEETGDIVIAAAREKNSDVRSVLGGKGGLGHPVAADGTVDREHSFSLEHYATGKNRLDPDGVLRDARSAAAPEDTGALMLDMSGYKVEDEKDEIRAKSKRAEQELEGEVSKMGIDESECADLAFLL